MTAKVTDLIKTTTDITSAAAPSQFAMHALSRDANGLLTYTKILWANTSESVSLTDGSRLAYNDIEDLISGVTPSGTYYNNTRIIDNENANKLTLANTFLIRVVNGNTATPSFTVNGLSNTTLTLEKGVVYTFQTDDFSTQNFPLYISAVAGDSNYTNEFTNGVSYSRSANDSTSSSLLTTNNSITPHSLIFTVPFDAPSTLYYCSGTNANCYAKMNITEARVDISRRTYEQVRFDTQQLTYYINSNGYFVARYGADYSY